MVKRLPRVDRIQHRVHLLLGEIARPMIARCLFVGIGLHLSLHLIEQIGSVHVSVVFANDGTAVCGVLWGCERP